VVIYAPRPEYSGTSTCFWILRGSLVVYDYSDITMQFL
jgi:hypothetical protein